MLDAFTHAHQGTVLWLPEAYGATAYGLCKGAGHKYIKRVPTGKVTKTGKPRYRYFYHAAHGGTVAHQDHFVTGASFRSGTGHQHITGRDGDTITLRHDETGEVSTMTAAELHAHLAGEHAPAIEAGRASALADLATAHANGASPKQLKRLEDRITRTGAALPARPGGTQHGSSENGGPGVRRPDAGATGDDRPHDGGAERKPRKPKVSAKAVDELLGPTEATASPYLSDPVAAQEWVPVPSPALTMHEDLAPAPTVKLPEHLKVFSHPNVKKGITQLFPHQIDGAERALSAFEHVDGIVISDDAGLGKTNTGMATLLGHGGKRNLIVVPTNGKHGIMRQWRETAALYGVPVVDGPPTSDDQEGSFLVSYDELVGKAPTPAEIEAHIAGWKLRLADAAAVFQRRMDEDTDDHGIYDWRARDKWRVKSDAANAERDAVQAEIASEAAALGLSEHLDYARRGGKKKPGPPSKGLADALKGNFDLAIFDEAHSMANADGQRAKAAMDLQANTGKAVYLSATPFTGVKDMHYLTKLGMFADRDEFLVWAKKAGAKVKGNVVENPSSALPMAAIAATMHVDGTMLKRTANLKGQTSQFRVLDKEAGAHPARNPDAAATFDGADRVFAEASAAGVLKDSFIKAFRSSWARQYWETLKVDEAIEQGKKALAEGKQVAFFTSYKGADHAHLRALVGIAERKADRMEESDDPQAQFKAMALRASAEKMQEIIDSLPKVEPAISRLVAAFGGPKQVAEIHGDTNKKPEEEQALYQSGARKVVVATMARGGTGISLHDDQGIAPRVQINLSLPWSGREFNQVAGRSHRLGSRSNTTMHWLVGDDDTEKKNATIVAKRLKSMGSLTVGDPEATIEARELANFGYGEALGTDLNAKEIADAALAAEDGDDDDDAPDEAQAARDYFREYAEARKAGRNVISEQYERRKLERETKAHAAARKALVQLATRWPGFSDAARFAARKDDAEGSLGVYRVGSQLKRDLERAGVAAKGRVSQNGDWYIDPEELPKIAKAAGVHRVEVDRADTKALAEKHARRNPDASDLKAFRPEPTPIPVYVPPPVATPESIAHRAETFRSAGLRVRQSTDGNFYVSGNTRQHVPSFRGIGARFQVAAEEWKVPARDMDQLARMVGGSTPAPVVPPPVVTVTPDHAGADVPEHVREFVDDYEGDVRAHAAKKLAGELSPASRQHWQDVERYAKSKLGKGGLFAPLIAAFAQ